MLDHSIRAEHTASQQFEAMLCATLQAGLTSASSGSAPTSFVPATADNSGGDARVRHLAELRTGLLSSRIENDEHERWLASLIDPL